MKKTAIAACAILSLLTIACSGSNEKNTTNPTVASDSTSTQMCNIRYINVDSILLSYTLAQELMADQQKELNALENTARQKNNDLQQRQSQIETKVRNNGYLTQESLNADMADLQQRQADAEKWYASQQERLARYVAAQQIRINDSLQNFLKDFNEIYKYDAIFDSKSGFFNKDLDITDLVIEGLNARYTPTVAPAKK